MGTPTYNFCVVVDDWDMQISHVIRGDDHVNNTPRQINILRALLGDSGAALPEYGHVPMILGPDGDKLSKRHGAVSVTQYEDDGYLPEAMLNYLARLGWSHGDAELFSREQLVEWFDGQHLAKSPAQWDPAKLNWVNAHYIKHTADDVLAALVSQQLSRRGIEAAADDRLARMCALFKDRCATTVELADWVAMYFVEVPAARDDIAAFVTDATKPAHRHAARQTCRGRLEQGRHRRRDQGHAGRTWAEDAATGAGRARAVVRAQSDAVARRGGGAVHARAGAVAAEEPVEVADIILVLLEQRKVKDLGGIAQLGERLHGMQEVSGSIPLTSTRAFIATRRSSEKRVRKSPSSRGLGHHPFTVITGVRIP